MAVSAEWRKEQRPQAATMGSSRGSAVNQSPPPPPGLPLAGGLPWQVRAFAGGGEGRMPAYKVAMALGIAGAAWWWYSQKQDVAQKQGAVGAAGLVRWGMGCCVACAGALALACNMQKAMLLALAPGTEAAVEKFGKHGEKAEYGKSFGQNVQVWGGPASS